MPMDQYGNYYPDVVGAGVQFNEPGHQWNFSNAVLGNAFRTMPALPIGYSRYEYERERQMVSNQYLSALSDIGASTAAGIGASYAIWGSPLQRLNELVPNRISSAAFSASKGVQDFLTSGTTHLSGATINAATKAAIISEHGTEYAGRVITASNTLREAVTTGGVLRRAGIALGTGFGNVVGGTLGFGASLVNDVGFAAAEGVSNFISPTGTSYVKSAASSVESWGADFALKEEGYARQAAVNALREARPGASADDLLAAGRTAAAEYRKSYTLGGAVKGITKAIGSPRSVLNSATILKMAETGGKIAGAVGGALLPALPYLYLQQKAIDYAAGMVEMGMNSNQLDKDLFEKSDRILGYGHADTSMGMNGGFTEAQRARFSTMLGAMADSSARKIDDLGFGKYGAFGGMSTYNKKFKELTDLFNVGADLGVFDGSRSMEEFERKFGKLVESTEKLTKVLKAGKEKVAVLIRQMQDEGFNDIGDAAHNLEYRNFVAKSTGQSLDSVMAISRAGSDAYLQRGIAPSHGSMEIQRANRYASNLIDTGAISKNMLAVHGGKEGLIGELFSMQQDIVDKDTAVQIEAMRYLKADGTFDEAAFNAAMSKPMTAEYGAQQNEIRSKYTVPFKINKDGQWITTSKYAAGLDRLRRARAEGKITPEMWSKLMVGLERQRSAGDPKSASMSDYDIYKQIAMNRAGATSETAEMYADMMTGRYDSKNARDAANYTLSEAKTRAEENRVGWWDSLYSNTLGAASYLKDTVLMRDNGKTFADYGAEWNASAETDDESRRLKREAWYRYKAGGKLDADMLADLGANNIVSIMRSSKKAKMSHYSSQLTAFQSGLLDLENAALAGERAATDLSDPMTKQFYIGALDRAARNAGKRTWYGASVEDSADSYIPFVKEQGELTSDLTLLANGARVAVSSADRAKRLNQALNAVHQAALVRSGSNKERIVKINAHFETMRNNIDYKVNGATATPEQREKISILAGRGTAEETDRERKENDFYLKYFNIDADKIAPVDADKLSDLFSKENIQRMYKDKSAILNGVSYSRLELDAYMAELGLNDEMRKSVSGLMDPNKEISKKAYSELFDSRRDVMSWGDSAAFTDYEMKYRDKVGELEDATKATAFRGALEALSRRRSSNAYSVIRNKAISASRELSKTVANENIKAYLSASARAFESEGTAEEIATNSSWKVAAKNITVEDIQSSGMSKPIQDSFTLLQAIASGRQDAGKLAQDIYKGASDEQSALSKTARSLDINLPENTSADTIRKAIGAKVSSSAEHKARFFDIAMEEARREQSVAVASLTGTETLKKVGKETDQPVSEKDIADGKVTTETIMLLHDSSRTLRYILQKLHL